ncbi:MAG: M23 family metallopeptidase [Bacteroidia bacterium]
MPIALLFAFLLLPFTSEAQSETAIPFGFAKLRVKSSDATRKCIPDSVRAQIIQKNNAALKKMWKDGRLQQRAYTKAPPTFIWPLRQTEGFDDPGFYIVSNYVDQDNTSNIGDWACGSRSYDGHDGIDLSIWPFRWNKKDASQVEIVAAADGVIIRKDDGNWDESCSWPGVTGWNAVYVQHSDGSVTWYGHMKNGSLTAKDSGDVVLAGEYLGAVGSSGTSTAPHLHFEVYDSGGNLIDPFAQNTGGCNNLNGNTSWWVNQLPYYDPGLNAMKTHISRPIVNPPCPARDSIRENTLFERGDSIIFTAYFRHFLTSDTAFLTVFDPSGNIATLESGGNNFLFDQTSSRSGNFHTSTRWIIYSRRIPANAPEGLWRYRVRHKTTTYGILTYNYYFWVEDCIQSPILILGNQSGDHYYRTDDEITVLGDALGGSNIIYDGGSGVEFINGFDTPSTTSKIEVKLDGCN